MLEATGLRDRAGRPFRTYSLGMKQRLAIAATLLKQPDLLIFDEPTNGLDPAGIHEIRTTMRRLADEGRTVLVSSHILAEVEQVADTVSIIGRGPLLASGHRRGGHRRPCGTVRVGVPDPAAAAQILTACRAAPRPRGSRCWSRAKPTRRRITWLLGTQGIWVRELTPLRPGLESAFLELTSAAGLPAAPGMVPPEGPGTGPQRGSGAGEGGR